MKKPFVPVHPVTNAATFALVGALTACGQGRQQRSPKDLGCVGSRDALNLLGGEPACAESWQSSHVLALTLNGALVCSGIRIGPNHLLTAAHCLSEPLSDFKVATALTDASETSASTGRTSMPLTTAAGVQLVASHVHPTFGSGRGSTGEQGDIAIILFTGHLPVTSVNLADLGDFAQRDEQLHAPGAALLTKSSFGLKSARDKSPASLTTVNLTVARLSAADHEFSYADASGRGSCDGDSGGPAFVTLDSGIKLVSITSRGPTVTSSTRLTADDACDNGGSIDTDVRYYRAWLNCAAERMQQQWPQTSRLQLREEAADPSRTDCAASPP